MDSSNPHFKRFVFTDSASSSSDYESDCYISSKNEVQTLPSGRISNTTGSSSCKSEVTQARRQITDALAPFTGFTDKYMEVLQPIATRHSVKSAAKDWSHQASPAMRFTSGSDSDIEVIEVSAPRSSTKLAAKESSRRSLPSFGSIESDSDIEVIESPAARLSVKPAAKDWGNPVSPYTKAAESSSDSEGRGSPAARCSTKPTAKDRRNLVSPYTKVSESRSVSNGKRSQAARRSKKPGAKKWTDRASPSMKSTECSSDNHVQESSAFPSSAKPAAKKWGGRPSSSTKYSDGDDQIPPATRTPAKPVASNRARKPPTRTPVPTFTFDSGSDTDDDEQEPTARKSSTGSNEDNEEKQEVSRPRRSTRDRKVTDLAAKNLHHNYTEPIKQKKKKRAGKSGRTGRRGTAKRKPIKGEEEFVVDKVLNQNIVRNGHFDYEIQYELSWVGYPQEANCWEFAESIDGEDILLQAFSKFPTSAEVIEDEYVYHEKDLERCMSYFDEWAQIKIHRKEIQNMFVEVKTDRYHLRIGMWYESLENAEQRFLIARLDNSRKQVAKCLVFIPSTNTVLKDTHVTEEGEVKYIYYKEASVPFDDLCEQYRRCKGSIPASQWRYSETAEHEFTIDSNKDQSAPSQHYLLLGIKPKVLVLCAGNSIGMSCGYEAAGLHVAWQVEEDETKYDSLRRNYSEKTKEGRKLFPRSIHHFLNKLRNGKYEFRNKNGEKEEVDHIHLSAPPRSNDYSSIAQAFVEYLKLLKPKTGMFDSSLDFLLEENIEILESLIVDLHRMHFQIRLMILDASDFGDPIETKRVVLLISEEMVYLPNRPMPTHGGGLHKKITVENELCFLEDVTPEKVVEIDGEQIYKHDPRSYVPTEQECEDFALDPNKPAPDMTGTIGWIHYSKERFLTIRELLCLKSFDEGYEILGSEQEMLQQIADAMPVALARAIARSIAHSYEFS
ncbi:MAG: hypothetical protein SGBAC_005983 [Bacillariaceae sp.]